MAHIFMNDPALDLSSQPVIWTDHLTLYNLHTEHAMEFVVTFFLHMEHLWAIVN